MVFMEKVPVGLEDAGSDLGVADRIRGPEGSNLSFITQQTGASVSLHESASTKRLYILISDKESLRVMAAKRYAQSLVESVRDEVLRLQPHLAMPTNHVSDMMEMDDSRPTTSAQMTDSPPLQQKAVETSVSSEYNIEELRLLIQAVEQTQEMVQQASVSVSSPSPALQCVARSLMDFHKSLQAHPLFNQLQSPSDPSQQLQVSQHKLQLLQQTLLQQIMQQSLQPLGSVTQHPSTPSSNVEIMQQMLLQMQQTPQQAQTPIQPQVTVGQHPSDNLPQTCQQLELDRSHELELSVTPDTKWVQHKPLLNEAKNKAVTTVLRKLQELKHMIILNKRPQEGLINQNEKEGLIRIIEKIKDKLRNESFLPEFQLLTSLLDQMHHILQSQSMVLITDIQQLVNTLKPVIQMLPGYGSPESEFDQLIEQLRGVINPLQTQSMLVNNCVELATALYKLLSTDNAIDQNGCAELTKGINNLLPFLPDNSAKFQQIKLTFKTTLDFLKRHKERWKPNPEYIQNSDQLPEQVVEKQHNSFQTIYSIEESSFQDSQTLQKPGFVKAEEREEMDNTGYQYEKGEKLEKEIKTSVSKKRKMCMERSDRWTHDLYNEEEQQPKSRQELIDMYGYDIRNEGAPPQAHRHGIHIAKRKRKLENKNMSEDDHEIPPSDELMQDMIPHGDGYLRVKVVPPFFNTLYSSLAYLLAGPLQSTSKLMVAATSLHDRVINFLQRHKDIFISDIAKFYDEKFPTQNMHVETAYDECYNYLSQPCHNGMHGVIQVVANMFRVPIVVMYEDEVATMTIFPRNSSKAKSSVSVLLRKDHLMFNPVDEIVTQPLTDCEPSATRLMIKDAVRKDQFCVATWCLTCASVPQFQDCCKALASHHIDFAVLVLTWEKGDLRDLAKVTDTYNYKLFFHSDSPYFVMLLLVNQQSGAVVYNFRVEENPVHVISAQIEFQNQQYFLVGCYLPKLLLLGTSSNLAELTVQVLKTVLNSHPPSMKRILMGNFNSSISSKDVSKFPEQFGNNLLSDLTDKNGETLINLALKFNLQVVTSFNNKGDEDYYVINNSPTLKSDTCATVRNNPKVSSLVAQMPKQDSHILVQIPCRSVICFNVWEDSHNAAIVACSIDLSGCSTGDLFRGETVNPSYSQDKPVVEASLLSPTMHATSKHPTKIRPQGTPTDVRRRSTNKKTSRGPEIPSSSRSKSSTSANGSSSSETHASRKSSSTEIRSQRVTVDVRRRSVDKIIKNIHINPSFLKSKRGNVPVPEASSSRKPPTTIRSHFQKDCLLVATWGVPYHAPIPKVKLKEHHMQFQTVLANNFIDIALIIFTGNAGIPQIVTSKKMIQNNAKHYQWFFNNDLSGNHMVLLVHNRSKASVHNFTMKNNFLLSAHIKFHGHLYLLVGCFINSKNIMIEKREEIKQVLNDTLTACPPDMKILLMGNFNASFSTDLINKYNAQSQFGSNVLIGKPNMNGTMLAMLAKMYNLKVLTSFNSQDKYDYTVIINSSISSDKNAIYLQNCPNITNIDVHNISRQDSHILLQMPCHRFSCFNIWDEISNVAIVACGITPFRHSAR